MKWQTKVIGLHSTDEEKTRGELLLKLYQEKKTLREVAAN
jgi:hypothetical protein